MNNPAPDIILSSPEWLPHRLNMQTGELAFVKINREGLAREAFLDDRMQPSVTGTAALPIAEIERAMAARANKPGQPPAFIFHTAFCCSTLMARALDAPGQSLALKEPDILMGLANAYRMAKSPQDKQRVDQVSAVILTLLSRPHMANENPIIKPTNTANNLAPIMAARGAPMILLYGELRNFLVSVIKKGEACKAFVRKQYTIFALDQGGVGNIPERQALGLTDLQIAALVWRHQMEMFASLLTTQHKHIRSLDFRVLLNQPAECLIAANNHLRLGIDEQTLRATATGPVFQKNSKFDDQDYDKGARARDEKALIERHEKELTMIEDWAKNIKLNADLPSTMPNPLLP